MKKTILWAALLIPCLSMAQKKKAIKFTNITQVGILTGQSENVESVQTINGISFKQSSIGLGVAYDTYGYKSIPVFIDARKRFGKGKSQLVLYADGGMNIPLQTDFFPETWFDGTPAYTLKKTFYGEAGLGLSRKISKLFSLNITAGYSYKHFSYVEHGQPWSSYYPYNSDGSTYNYYYRRFALRLGLQLN